MNTYFEFYRSTVSTDWDCLILIFKDSELLLYLIHTNNINLKVSRYLRQPENQNSKTTSTHSPTTTKHSIKTKTENKKKKSNYWQRQTSTTTYTTTKKTTNTKTCINLVTDNRDEGGTYEATGSRVPSTPCPLPETRTGHLASYKQFRKPIVYLFSLLSFSRKRKIKYTCTQLAINISVLKRAIKAVGGSARV